MRQLSACQMRGPVIVMLVDENERRRARLTHQFSSDELVIRPFGGADELRLPADPDAFYLVHDDGKLLEAVLKRSETFGAWMPVIAFSEDPKPGRVVDTIFGGAMDYLEADFSFADLSESFARVNARAQLIRVGRDATLRARSNMERLSQREREVISALTDGLSNKRIAQRLNISPRTVEIHRTNALGKMGAANSYEAIRIALESKVLRTN